MGDLFAGADPAPRPSGYRILALTAENIKRIEVVEIRPDPDSDVVEITGRNRQGKTSVLDAMWWTLAGTRNMQSEPIRRGADEGFCELDLGEIIVRRNIRKGDAGVTTSLSVRTPAGAEYRRPQATIDTFFNALSLDPMHFMSMELKEKFQLLRQFVPDVDFEAVERANADDYARRRDFNAQARQAAGLVARMVVDDEAAVPDRPIDIEALTAELEAAGRTNTETESRRARREGVEQAITQSMGRLRELDGEIERLRQNIASCEDSKTTIQASIDSARQCLAEAPPLPDMVDTVPLRARISEAQAINARVDTLRQRRAAEGEVARLKAEGEALTKAMEDRTRAADGKIAAAAMPVPGLTLTTDGTVLLNGFPLDQASDAEQLRASIELAMALNPKLRVIRVRDGSLLDPEAMALIRTMAKERECQVWLERVTGDDGGGFELVAGRIRQREPAPA